MATLAPPLAAIRVAVRRALTDIPTGGLVLVACSGGADSLALAAATAFVAPRLGIRAGLVTIDHNLQPGSAQRADAVVAWASHAGLDPVRAVSVDVSGRPGGPEAAAREARYEALVALAKQERAPAVLFGHTRDDQAETVLLALARGAGPRGLSGMPAEREVDGVRLLRPLLDIGRAETRAACTVLGLTPWDDPHNVDPSYARARVRADVIPVLVRALGPAVVENLARTAALIAADTVALDEVARSALEEARTGTAMLSVAALARLVPAVRTRVLHFWARELGAPPAALSHRHVAALAALVTDWRGQGPVHLPGAIRVLRRDGSLRVVDGDADQPASGRSAG